MDRRKRILNLMDKILIGIICISILLFILLPFYKVFEEAFFREGILDLSIFDKFFKRDIRLVKNSLKQGILTSLLSVTISVAISIYYYITDEKRKKLINLLLMLTMISPPFVTSLSYINLFGRRGLITYRLLKLNLNPYGLSGIVLMQSLNYISLNSIILIGILRNMDKSVIDSARSLGAKTDDIIKDMILPMLRQGINVIILLTFIRSMADFSTPAIIGGSYDVLATEAYLSIIAGGDIRRSAFINILLFIPSIIIFFLYRKSFMDISASSHGSSASSLDMKREGRIYNIFRAITIFFLMFLALQYIAIFTSALTKMRKGKMYWTLDNIRDSRMYISGTFIRSIGYSLIVGVISGVLGTLIIYYSYIRDIKFMKFIDYISTMPYIVPGTFFGIGYILAFNKPPIKLTGTAIIVVLNALFRQLPFSSKVISSSVGQINKDLINSVRDLGGPSLYELKDVVFPLCKEGLFVSFINGFTSTMTTIGSIIFLVHPTQKLATLVLFDVIESGKYGVGSVIACLILLICLFVNGIYYYIMSKRS